MSDSVYQRSVTAASGSGQPVREQVQDYWDLLKPRVMTLVVFSGIAGLIVAPGSLHPVLAAVAILCIAVSAGAAGAINMWYDRDIDAVMARTKRRPIPTGRVEPSEALAFGIVLTIFSVMVMGLAVNWTAAALLALATLFYVFVYTIWLKRRTPQNIVIGGAAGAFPPMIGWAAVTGTVDPGSILLFGLIFMWTPPHFWALSLYRCEDYAKVGVPMLPVVAGKAATKRQMLLYTLLLLPLAPLPAVMGLTGWLYGVAALLLGLAFVGHALRVLRSPEADGEDHKPAKAMFKFSLTYLFGLFGLMMLDKAPGLVAFVGLGG
ncbi:heme o synthase [Algihabitans albus]|uniref:heme o synthase n=1 Tax=Algihabitans albus TaxID=2164067 RepID=UPI000E5D65CC|nr:heme o synthase [Algihabitans albus]